MDSEAAQFTLYHQSQVNTFHKRYKFILLILNTPISRGDHLKRQFVINVLALLAIFMARIA